MNVSVMVLSYNQGKFLDECLDSVADQSGVGEVLVADHGSSDRWSLERAERAAAERGMRFLALSRQGSVARARNVAIAETSGEMVLPLDADNVLLPGAVERMAAILAAAAPEVGFVYPRLTYFSDAGEWERPMPAYNLYALMLGNYCDTAGLYERRCFEDGLGFPEGAWHEDWAFALRLAERGVHGIAADSPTVRLRRHGFGRSLQGGATRARLREVTEVVPELYEPERFLAEKARWAPALSVVAEGEREALEHLLAAQSCRDAELLTRPGADALERLAAGSRAARGGIRLLAGPNAERLLGRRELVEQLVRLFAASPGGAALVLVAGERRYPLEPLADADPRHALAVALRGDPCALGLAELELAGEPLHALARAVLSSGLPVELRGWPGPPPPTSGDGSGSRRVVLADPPRGEAETNELRFRLETPALLPGAPLGAAALGAPAPEPWTPRDTVRLVRFLEPASGRRAAGTLERPGAGIVEAELGWLWRTPMPGTVPLRVTGAGLLARCTDGEDPVGHAEEVDLTGMDELLVVETPGGDRIVATAAEDPAAGGARVLESLGYAEPHRPFPQEPRRLQPRTGRLALGRVPGPESHGYVLAAEASGAELDLGLLLAAPAPGAVPLYGVRPPPAAPGPAGLVAPRERPPSAGARLAALPRWLLAPLRWRSFGGLAHRLELIRWRARLAPRLGLRPQRVSAEPLAWAWADDGPGRAALYGAWHPVTADRLLTLDPAEARNLGYGEPRLLGYVEATGPNRFGDLSLRRPWCSRGGELYAA